MSRKMSVETSLQFTVCQAQWVSTLEWFYSYLSMTTNILNLMLHRDSEHSSFGYNHEFITYSAVELKMKSDIWHFMNTGIAINWNTPWGTPINTKSSSWLNYIPAVVFSSERLLINRTTRRHFQIANENGNIRFDFRSRYKDRTQPWPKIANPHHHTSPCILISSSAECVYARF